MLRQGVVNGHTAWWLENEQLRVGVLPGKGADIFDFSYKSPDYPQPIQLLMQTPWGLKPPGPGPQADFLENYEGGWQELFPNANDGCEYRGQAIPFHGEVALEQWEVKPPPAEIHENVLHLSVDCRKTPFRLERELFLRREESQLVIQEKITNLSSTPCDFVWGHHIVLGGDFLEADCELEVPAREFFTPDVLFEPLTARLEAAQAGNWPLARTRQQGTVDLRKIPGPEAHSHDDVILGALQRGFYRAINPRLKLAFSLEWDVHVFPWLMFWQPYGGADLPPLTGIYGVGLEPWASRYPLAKAVEAGQARSLRGGESLQTELIATVQQL
jgi:hypothetical protein